MAGFVVLVAIVTACGSATPPTSARPSGSASPATVTVEPSVSDAPSQTPAPPTEPPTAPPTVVPATPSPSPTPAEVGGAFGRRDVPPGGVAEILGFTIPAARLCIPPESVDPNAGVWLSRFSESVPTFVCAVGFDADSPIDFSLTGPDGVVRTETTRTPWRLGQVSDPFQGSYRLVAAQGALTIEREDVWQSTDVNVVAFPPAVTRGEPVQVAVAAPGAPGPHPAYLYQAGTGPTGLAAWLYIADLGPVDVDNSGEGRLTLTSSPDDEAGGYAVWVDGRLANFILE